MNISSYPIIKPNQIEDVSPEAFRKQIQSDNNIDIKSFLPSSPVWYGLQIDWGLWTPDRQRMHELMGFYQKNSDVHGCISLIANSVVACNPTLMKVVNAGASNLRQRGLSRLSSVRQKRLKRQWDSQFLSRKSIGDDEELVTAEGHEFYGVLNNDINDLYFLDLIRLTVINLCIYGIAFWYKGDRDDNGMPTSYLYLPTYNVIPDRGGEGELLGWFYSTTWGDLISKANPIAKEDMIVFRWPSTTDPHASGDSPLLAALQKVQLSQKWIEFQDNLITNRARPDMEFIPAKTPDGTDLTQEQIDRSEKAFNDRFRGAGNGRIKVSGQAGTLVPLQYPPTDLAPLQFNEELRKALLFCLGVPEAFTNADSNRANQQAADEQYTRYTIAPITTIFERNLTKEAQVIDPTLQVVFENVIVEDDEFELRSQEFELSKWTAALQYGGLLNNDYRTNILGLDPIEEPEPTPAPEVQPEEPEKEEEPQQPETEKSFDIVGLNKEVYRGKIDRATAISILAYALNKPDAEVKKLITYPKAKKIKNKKLKPPVVPSHADLTTIIKMQMDKQQTHYIAQLTGNKDQEVDGITIKATEMDEDGLPKEFKGLDEWDAEDAQQYKPYIQIAYNDTAKARQKTLVQLGAEEDSFSVVPDNVQEAVDNDSLQMAVGTNNTTEDNINAALLQLRADLVDSVVEGDPIALMRQKIEDVFAGIDGDRADTIAQTEISNAVHSAQKITAKASGVVKGFKLLVSPDCCDECNELAGMEIGIDGRFNEDNTYFDSPIPVHVNCRCTMVEIIKDLKEPDDNQE